MAQRSSSKSWADGNPIRHGLAVDDLLITDQLKKRARSPPRGIATSRALHDLSRQISAQPSDVLPRLVALAQQLCGGGSAGVSVYEPQPDGAIFRWAGLTGKATPFNGETTPRDFSPCGVCLDRAETILMDRPGRYYDWLNLPGLPLTEALLVPLLIRGTVPFGTLWVMSHDAHQFDIQHAEALNEVAGVACLAITLLADMAEQKSVFEQSNRQATKMETLGHLAAGIAHDFNNLLTVLTGQLDIIEKRVQDDNLRKMAERGLKATARGEKLVKQIMAFARKMPKAAEIIDLQAGLLDVVEIVERSFPEMEVRSKIADDLWHVLIDENQFQSAILNLAINAKDAMRGKGHLTVEARNAHLLKADDPGLEGDFLVVAVSDNGPGMSSEVLERAFEPFYTTKGIGVGTGLGLSLVRDFATGAGGSARIHSELGKGAAITIYLPRARDGSSSSLARTPS